MADAAKHIDDYHEDYGSVLWWTNPVSEAPYVGRPDDSDWPGYHQWWTPAPAYPTQFKSGMWARVRALFEKHAQAYAKQDRYEMCSAIADEAARDIEDMVRQWR